MPSSTAPFDSVRGAHLRYRRGTSRNLDRDELETFPKAKLTCKEESCFVELCVHQTRYLQRIIKYALDSQIYLPSLLLTGPAGSGKRTIAFQSAHEIGIDFVEVSLKQSKHSVAEQLFGTLADAKRSIPLQYQERDS